MRIAALLLVAGCGRFSFGDRPDAAVDVKPPRPPLVWHAETTPVTDKLFDIWGSSATDIYAVGNGSALLHSTGNDTWTLENVPVTTALYGVGATTASDVIVAGNATPSGMAILRPNGAGGWQQEPNTLPQVLNDGYVASPTNMWVIGYGGLIAHSNGDGSWTSESTGTSATLFTWWASGPNDFYVVGDAGTLLRSTGDGTWTPQSTGTQAKLVGVGGSSANDVWAVGYSGKILHSTGNGVWTAQDANVGFDLYNVFTVDGFVLACGVGNTVITSEGDGVWTQQQLPVPSTQICDGAWGPTADDIHLALDGGVILRGTR
ncbi:MAG TPA: hypothetical protein VMZ53_09600 [Kofleriaceae bacterium]|nr:hypothetical protein [Kofleriaceae bacterium]